LGQQQAPQGVTLKQRSWAGQVLEFNQQMGLNQGPAAVQMELPKEVLAAMHQRYLAEYQSPLCPRWWTTGRTYVAGIPP